MTAHIRCLCSRCAGDFEAHPGVVADMTEGSKSRHPSTSKLVVEFPDGSQLDGDLVRSSKGAEWRQLRLDLEGGD